MKGVDNSGGKDCLGVVFVGLRLVLVDDNGEYLWL